VTTVFLVRHATHALLGRVLVGRMPDVPLSTEGREQAGRLAARLKREGVTALQASPQQRAQETAAPTAQATGIPLETAPAMDELDLGEWTGQSFDELRADPRFAHWNTARSHARPPGGESMAEVQERVARHLAQTCTRAPDGRVVIFSHADVIRAALFHYLGLSLDRHERLEISPAGISMLALGAWGAKVLMVNEVPAG
jgi:broad specificity phosphatase PhoE